MVLFMVVAGVAVFAIGCALIVYVLRRGSDVSTTEEEFGKAYDGLVAKGRIAEGADRKAAWREFDAWQQANEEDERSWEDGADG